MSSAQRVVQPIRDAPRFVLVGYIDGSALVDKQFIVGSGVPKSVERHFDVLLNPLFTSQIHAFYL